jgi:CheY-like chemotaxis protein
MPTVFVVDSGAMRGTPLIQSVREVGYHTLPMANADMALAVLNAIRADLLLVDLRDAQTGGPRLIEEIRRNERLRRMPILAVGGRADGEEIRRLRRRVGIGDVLTEGEFTHEELVREIRKYVACPATPLIDAPALEWTN